MLKKKKKKFHLQCAYRKPASIFSVGKKKIGFMTKKKIEEKKIFYFIFE
jgi:hypothetical protein